MSEARPGSVKVRALSRALGAAPEAIAAAYRAQPRTYREIAAEWEQRVRARFPELDLRFTSSDVYRLFKQYGRSG